jgi:hypothetical protein
MSNERVVLNVGGQKYEVFVSRCGQSNLFFFLCAYYKEIILSLSSLIKFPETLLGNMFLPENRESFPADDRGEYFFDR